MKKTRVAIVILSFNTKKLLQQCLESIYRAIEANNNNYIVEIIVVDNGSTDGSVEIIKNAKSKIKNENLKLKIILNKENLGFARGNNKGIHSAIKAGADYVMVLNSDVVVDKNFLNALMESFQINKKIGVAGPKIYFAPGYEFYRDRYKKEERGKVIWSAGGIIDWDNVIASNRGVDEVDRGQYNKAKEVDFISGCCLVAPSLVWEKVDFFDERYFLYYEDADFCQKVKKIGLKVVCAPKSFIWHKVSSSSQIGGDLQDYFITRNRLLFGIKWAPLRAKLALVKEGIKLWKNGRQWQKKGAKDFFLKKFGQGSWKSKNEL